MPMLALPGGFVGGSMIEKIGRKATIEFSAVPFASGKSFLFSAELSYRLGLL